MENKTYSEQEAALVRLIDRVINSRLSWSAIERWVSHYSARLAEVRAAQAAQQAQSAVCGPHLPASPVAQCHSELAPTAPELVCVACARTGGAA